LEDVEVVLCEVVEVEFEGDLVEAFESFFGVAREIPAELGHAVGAEVEGAAVSFFEVVGAIHQAIMGDTMGDGKDVSRFVEGCLEGALEEEAEGVVRAGGIAVSRHRPDAHAFFEGGHPKDVAPTHARPEVVLCEGEGHQSILGQGRLEDVKEQIASVELLVAEVILSGCPCGQR
jgi:hypothetical protein